MTDVILLYSLLLAVSTLLSLFEVSILTINSRNLELLSQERVYLAFFEKRKDKFAEDINEPTHLMFNMATGTGKTMMMAALIL